MPDGPSRHVQKPRRRRRPPLRKPPPRTEHSVTRTVPARPARRPRGPRMPGLADANFREQKSCLQMMRELRGERGRRAPARGVSGLEPRRAEGAAGRRRPRARPGQRTFPQGPGRLAPRLR